MNLKPAATQESFENNFGFQQQLKPSVAADDITYQRAIQKLNALQSNAAAILKSQNEGPESHVQQAKKVESTTTFLSRIGITLEQVDTLSVIHIAGTKGKGTTAALCESILRKHGYRTGFFSSPHLVAVRERIRIDGVPLSPKKFADYFDSVYSRLEQLREQDDDMPSYFKFLTVMAFHVFLREYVDVAIVEVGIGGEYDCTNCIRKPVVVGITTLGLDHTNLLGSTLPDIAWQKAGIFKRGCRAFTVSQPSPTAMDVLREKAFSRQCSLHVVPPLQSYTWETLSNNLSQLVEDVYASNASLALQLAKTWMDLQSPFINTDENIVEENDFVHFAEPFHISKQLAIGLAECSWPGRTQIIIRENVTYFLDGAHTEESINYCLDWFNNSSPALQPNPARPKRVLIFNVTGERNASMFLQLLATGHFDVAIFTAISAFSSFTRSSDCFSLKDSDKHTKVLKTLNRLSENWRTLKPDSETKVCDTISEALDFIIADNKGKSCHVLITGSLHLVGAALSVLDPNLIEPVVKVPVSLRPLQSFYGNVQAIL